MAAGAGPGEAGAGGRERENTASGLIRRVVDMASGRWVQREARSGKVEASSPPALKAGEGNAMAHHPGGPEAEPPGKKLLAGDRNAATAKRTVQAAASDDECFPLDFFSELNRLAGVGHSSPNRRIYSPRPFENGRSQRVLIRFCGRERPSRTGAEFGQWMESPPAGAAAQPRFSHSGW